MYIYIYIYDFKCAVLKDFGHDLWHSSPEGKRESNYLADIQ